MPLARKRLVSLDDTPYYHCIARCVRQAFLCGKDPLTGFDFEHRRQWIVDRMKLLASVFAIDLCAYAVMSNHYHVVIRVNRQQAREWSNREVAEHWTRIFSGPDVVQHWLKFGYLSDAEYRLVSSLVETWRERLHDISWFMRCLNEPIARIANHEDDCKGRFWEGRFTSQALLDERAVLTCMAYVDLNPIRATIARTPENSNYTSIQERIRQPDDQALRPFAGCDDDDRGLPFNLRDYLELVDWAGRQIRCDNKGHIPESAPPIVQRLAMDSTVVLDFLKTKRDIPIRALGSASQLRSMAQSVGLKFLRGVALAKRLCPDTS
jgi:REP element-mobilizing transposase RayT